MTVSSTVTKSGPYAGAGTTGPFTVGFRFLDDTHLRVVRTDTNGTDTDLVLDTDYSVTGAGAETGTVTLVSALTTGQKLTIVRNVPATQEADYVQNDAFPAESHETALDKLTMISQQLLEASERSIKISASDPPLTPLPTAPNRINQLVGFDSVGGLTLVPVSASIGAGDMIPYSLAVGVDFNPGDTQVTIPRDPGVKANIQVNFDASSQDFAEWNISGTTLLFTAPGGIPAGVTKIWGYIGTTLSVVTPPEGSINDSAIAVLSPISGSVFRTQHDKNQDLYTGMDAGVVGDGVAEDLAALQAAAAAFPGPVDLPAGRQYKLGGVVSILGSHTLWDELAAGDTPYDTARIQRNVSAVGNTAQQTGGHIIRTSVGAGVNHHEFGYFSVFESRSTAALEHVGMYSQISSAGDGASVIWGGVDEVKNVQPDGSGTSVNHAMAGREIDVVNKFAFSDTLKKIGVECIAWGGGESTEAFSVYAANNTRGNGSYATGHWRYGFRILGNAIDATAGVGLQILSSNGTAIQVVGASANYGIHLNPDAASPVGLNIEANYTTPIAVPQNKKINLNGIGGTQGLYFDSTAGAIIAQAASIGVLNNASSSSASAGAASALPATPGAYISFYLNGVPGKLAWYPV